MPTTTLWLVVEMGSGVKYVNLGAEFLPGTF